MQALCAELLEVRSQLRELRANLAKEIRTERLAVVHPDDGRELISTKVLPNSISLRVAWGSTADAETGLVSAAESGDDVSTADVYVGGGGNVQGMMPVVVDRSDGSENMRADLSLETEGDKSALRIIDAFGERRL